MLHLPKGLLNKDSKTGVFMLILWNCLFWRTSENGCFSTGKIYVMKASETWIPGKQYYHKASSNKNRLSVCLGRVSKIRTSSLWYVWENECVSISPRVKCPKKEFFLVHIFSYSDWIRIRKNSVFGHFSSSVCTPLS